MLLLQATLDGAVDTLDATAISYIELVLKGGIPMLAIGLMSVYGAYLFITKFWEFRQINTHSAYLLTDVRKAVSNINRSQALRLCGDHKSPFGRILDQAVRVFFLHNGNPKPINDVIENQCDLEHHILERNLSRLAVIATLAPMTGFLGTVVGILMTFMAMSQQNGGTINSEFLSEGMYQAMVTTVAGLVVGIIAHGSYFILARKLNDITLDMKKLAYGFMGMVHGSSE